MVYDFEVKPSNAIDVIHVLGWKIFYWFFLEELEVGLLLLSYAFAKNVIIQDLTSTWLEPSVVFWVLFLTVSSRFEHFWFVILSWSSLLFRLAFIWKVEGKGLKGAHYPLSDAIG